jgi:predicted AAA+ superfamily ATPase
MVSKDVLEDVIEEWTEEISNEKVIHRDISGEIEKTLNYEEVTVIGGVRRSGKTFTLYELFQKHGGIYINFEDDRLYDFTIDDFEKVVDITKKNNQKILYFDEVQEVSGWEKFAHRTHRKIKILVTGSNSRLLSSEFSKSLVGRTKSYSIYPLSYSEFLRFRKLKRSRNSLSDYMKVGGFPRIVLTDDLSLANEYFERMIYRDILGREKVMYPEAVKTLAIYLLSNIGKEFSYRSLKNICGVKHENTVKDYIGKLKEAFLIQVINRFHPSLKIQESYGKKAYAIDPSFVHLGKRGGPDRGRILENMVFLHLLREGYEVYFGKNKKEVDFVICEGLKPQRIMNVTYEAETMETKERELASLLHFQKEIDVEGAIVSMYPFKLSKDIELLLAHRFLE